MESTREERLAELRKSVSQMTDEELYELIGVSRNNRRPPPPKPKKVKKKGRPKKEKESPEPNLESMLANLSPEQAAALLKKLS